MLPPHPRLRLPLLCAAAGLVVLTSACSDDADDAPDVSGVIPSDDTTVSSGIPATDGSPLTTPAPNVNAGGATSPPAP